MCLVLVFLSSSAFALIGPPTAELSKGQWSIGGNYQYSSQDLDKIKITWSGSYIDYEPDGDVFDEGPIGPGSYKLETRNLNTNVYYGRLSYGLLDTWEVYGQAGIADVKAEAKVVENTEWHGYNLDNELAWGLGTKYTFLKKEKIDWGVGVQLNFYSNSVDDDFSEPFDDEGYTGTETWTETTDIDTLGIVVAVGPTIDMGGWNLYGGALFQSLTADYDYKEEGSWIGEDDYYGNWTIKDSGDTDTISFGGYVGAKVGVYNNCSMAIEFVGTNNGWGAGAGFTIPF
jgi:hypothetical protein